MSSLGNKPVVVIIGLIASIIAIVVFLSGKESIGEFVSTPTAIQSSPIEVTVIVQPANISTTAPQVIIVTTTSNNSSAPSSGQSEQSSQNLDPPVDSDNPEGFLRWYFHEIWATRDYDYLWEYLSVDFRQRLDQDFATYESNWEAIGSIEEPIEITYEGKDGVSEKYRVQYTTLSRKNGFTDRRRDLYWLYFNPSKGHWEFK